MNPGINIGTPHPGGSRKFAAAPIFIYFITFSLNLPQKRNKNFKNMIFTYFIPKHNFSTSIESIILIEALYVEDELLTLPKA